MSHNENTTTLNEKHIAQAELPVTQDGTPALHATTDLERVEAPVTVKAYLMCAFAAFGGIFFGFDSGYIGGVLAMPYFRQLHVDYYDKNGPEIAAGNQSLIVSMLSLGTFIGSLVSADFADRFGRRTAIMLGCVIFAIGVILQIASTTGLGLLVTGRVVSGLGVGFVAAMIILYMSEIAPKKVRGAIVSGYQFCITLGLLLASCVTYATENRNDTGSYRIPIGVQFAWAIILFIGLYLLPESPRYWVKRGDLGRAAQCLARVRGQPSNSDYVQEELAEIVANCEYENSVIPSDNYFSSWLNCFKGGLRNPGSNLRRTILGTSLQMMQQWTGVNFVFYFGPIFFQTLGTIPNVFLISLITNLVNVCSTPISFYTVEKWGRRTILIYGAAGMLVCEFLVGIIGTALPTQAAADGSTAGVNNDAVRAMIAFICIYIFFFASTWGPGAWVVIGEIFPIPIRARGVALSTASNWIWNVVIAVITPYLVGSNEANLGPKVFFIWGSTCTVCLVYSIFLVSETKGLTLEQVDRMFEETTPMTSAAWRPKETFAAQMGITEKGILAPEVVADVTKRGGSVV